MQLSLDGFDVDQQELLSRLNGWPQSFETIRYQTGWGRDRSGRAIESLLVAQRIIKLCDGAFSLNNPHSI